MTVTVAGEPTLAYLLASLRIVAWLVVVPPFSTRAVPTMAKVVLAMGLAFAITPQATNLPVDTLGFAMNALTQVMVGAAMGFMTMLLFQAVASAGALIDMFGGFSLASGFDPLGMQMNSVFGKFHQALATMLLFATGGHLLVIGGLLKTFELMPLGTSPHMDGGTELLTRVFGVFFTTTMQVALPMVAVLFVADLGLALMTKVAPQLNAMNVMFPAKIGLTLLLVGMCFPVLPGVVERLTELSMEAMSTFASMGGG